jgi:glycosyltransferase involved in cell wall biosynthesis
MRVSLFPDLAIENWKSMDVYADRLSALLPEMADGWEIQRVMVQPSQWLDRYLRVPYLNRALNDRFYSRYIVYTRMAKALQGDINHVLDHSYGHLLRALDPQRTIVTVHDLYPLHIINRSVRTLREHARNRLLRWVMDHTLRARWLIVPSEFTKQELLRLTDYPTSRISVVHLGVDETFFQSIAEETKRRYWQELGLPENGKLLLHVGSCDERKNIPLLLHVLKVLLSRSGTNFYLLQIGGQFTKDQSHLIHQLSLASRLRQRPHVSVDELVCAYQTAHALLLPSTYEGFGFPALEAMAAGTPVIASDIGALREIIGESGILVEPNDPARLAEAVMAILDDARFRESFIEKGRARAAGFSWSETARKTLAVYHQVYSERV